MISWKLKEKAAEKSCLGCKHLKLSSREILCDIDNHPVDVKFNDLDSLLTTTCNFQEECDD